MSNLIVHHNGAYNIYNTVSDQCLFRQALTLEQLKDHISHEYGRQGRSELPERLARAHIGGSSSVGLNLEDMICCNRAGPNESSLSLAEFIARYLTVAPSDTQPRSDPNS